MSQWVSDGMSTILTRTKLDWDMGTNAEKLLQAGKKPWGRSRRENLAQ